MDWKIYISEKTDVFLQTMQIEALKSAQFSEL